jgi:hypothetical protein
MKIIINESSVNRDELQLDLKGYAKGVYYIQFTEVLQTFKICVI